MNISVALCTYNGEKYITKQLDSIFNQTKPIEELIICDDMSTDNTMTIIENYKITYPEIIKIHQNSTNLKTIKNFEKAVSLCTGDWIFLCDQDDVWSDSKVEVMINYVTKHPKTLLLFSDGNLIDQNDNLLQNTLWEKWNFTAAKRKEWKKNQSAFRNLLNNKNYVTGATALISKNLKKFIIPVIVPADYYHDSWFALNAAGLNGLRFIEKSLINYRIHENQQVGITLGGKNTECVKEDNGISRTDYIKLMSNRFKKPSIIEKILIFCRK